MPRVIPTTTWNDRTPPTTTWAQPRSTECLTWNEATFPWDDATFTWDSTCEGEITIWNKPRYSTYIEDINGINLEDMNGVDLEGISGNEVNIIDTTWQ